MTDPTLTYAKPDHAFMRVVTPNVAREYEIPLRGKLTGTAKRHYDELRDLAELHRTAIESNPYRTL